MINIDAIRSGLDNGEFFLEYLPTVSLEDGRCLGAETLIRWRRPSGVLLPDSFIPMVENTPLSGLMTYWVIDTVALELSDWLQANEDIHLSLNVPPEILGRGGLEYAAVKSGLAAFKDKLILEVTERGIPDKLGLDAINSMNSSGVRIALDDVSGGGANLALLCRAGIDIIKLAKVFMDEMLQENWSPDTLSGITMLVKTTNIEVIAEGVETASQVDILKKAGVKMAQGWYFSRPLPADDFTAFFYDRR